jgi:DNA invertase Pin-like site-specific DNA recombinase
MFHLMAALAEFERDVIRERTLAGLDAARARGRTGGRRKATETLRASATRSRERTLRCSTKQHRRDHGSHRLQEPGHLL